MTASNSAGDIAYSFAALMTARAISVASCRATRNCRHNTAATSATCGDSLDEDSMLAGICPSGTDRSLVALVASDAYAALAAMNENAQRASFTRKSRLDSFNWFSCITVPSRLLAGKATPRGVLIGIKADDAVSRTRQDVNVRYRIYESYTLS